MLPNGFELTDATTDEIGWGQSWLLVGDELIGFHEAEADVGGVWRLRGLIRGMRNTDLAMDTHQDGERVVLLPLLGFMHGLVYDAPGGYAAANRTYCQAAGHSGHPGNWATAVRWTPWRPVFCRCSAAGPARQLICSWTTPRPTALSSGWASAPIPGM